MGLEVFKVSIIGAGKIAEEHIKAFRSLNGVSVNGIFSRTKSNALRLAQRYDIAVVANDIQDLYVRTSADLVVVAVTIDASKEIIELCWQYDWSVLTEKPLGLNYTEALNLSQKAASLNKDCFVAFNRRHYASVEWVRQQISTQTGPLYISAFGQESLHEVCKEGFSEKILEHWMFANSIHIIDLILFFADSPVKAIHKLNRYSAGMDPGVVSAFIEFENGSTSIYQCNWDMQGPWGLSISARSNRWELKPLETAYMQTNDDRAKIYMPEATIDVEFKPGFKRQAERAVYASKGHRKFEANLLDGLETMRIVDDIFLGN